MICTIDLTSCIITGISVSVPFLSITITCSRQEYIVSISFFFRRYLISITCKLPCALFKQLFELSGCWHAPIVAPISSSSIKFGVCYNVINRSTRNITTAIVFTAFYTKLILYCSIIISFCTLIELNCLRTNRINNKTSTLIIIIPLVIV